MKYLWLVLAILPLTACVTPRKSLDLDPGQLRTQWLQGQDRLSQIQTWEIKGRAAVSTADDSGTVSMFWQQQPDDFQLKLVAPFGRGTLDIRSDNGGVVMRDPKGRELRAATAQGLVWMKTGWEIPIEDMRAWVLGVVDDDENPTVQVDQFARTAAFASRDWQVSYPDYTVVERDGERLELPRKVYMQSEHLKVKLVISEWTLN